MIILKLKSFVVVFFTTVVLLSLTACNTNHKMHINVKSGDEYKYHTLISITSDNEIYGQTSSAKQDTTTEFKIKVDNVDSEGNITMNYIYDHIKFEADTDGTKQLYDSDNSNPNDFSAVYKNIVGKGFTAKMTKYGEVTEVTGVDELLNTIVTTLYPGMDDETYIEETKKSFNSTFGDFALKSLVQLSTKIFPDKKVKIGDSWDIEATINTIEEINAKITYTLDKIENKTAYLSVKSEFSTDKSKVKDYMGMAMTTDLTGTITGTIKVNMDNCFISEGELTQNLSGKMSVVVPSISGSEEETLDIPMNSTTVSTYSITKM